MRVRVRLLRRHGRLLHKTEQSELPGYIGDLSVAEVRDVELGRPLVRARLRDIQSGTKVDVLPELSDACLLWAESDKLRLTGFERVDDADYAQTWSVELVRC